MENKRIFKTFLAIKDDCYVITIVSEKRSHKFMDEKSAGDSTI